MGFADLKSHSGMKVLNDYLESRSYIDGYEPSQADVAVFEALANAPSSELHHALRWFNHIKSYGNEKVKFPGEKKAASAYGPIEGTPAPAEEDDIDLFGSDDENEEEAEKLRQERLAAYEEKKKKKPVLIAKSSIILEVKPWDDTTDMAEMEKQVRTVQMDGLVWGASKLVPVGYGIRKLQINCIVEDDKVGTDFLEESITAFEDIVQSVDVVAFNKI